MKRKARRRLVGAIVLALAAAIILPMLLEKEPRPLGDDVSVQIPPVDSGKFVNRLTGKAGDDKALPKTESKAIAAAPGKSEAKAEAPAQPAAPASASPSAAQRLNPRSPPRAGDQVRREERIEDGAEGRVQGGSAVRARKRTQDRGRQRISSAAPPAQAASANAIRRVLARGTATTSKPDGFVRAARRRLPTTRAPTRSPTSSRRAATPRTSSSVNTSRGTLWRVRVGGYGTRPEADDRARRAEGRRLQRDHRAGAVTPAGEHLRLPCTQSPPMNGFDLADCRRCRAVGAVRVRPRDHPRDDRARDVGRRLHRGDRLCRTGIAACSAG